MYMDDIKILAKNEKELETLIHTEYIVKTMGWNLALKNALCSSWKVANEI